MDAREFGISIDVFMGKVFVAIDVDKQNDIIKFTTDNNEWYVMRHAQDCCEDVWIESVTGDIKDLIGSPILIAEEVIQEGKEEDSSTWTFYKFATSKGYVDIRWIGESNGYYSESVDLYQIKYF